MSDQAVSSRRSSGFARLLRGWLVAFLAVMLAAGGHQAAHSVIHGTTTTIPLQLLVFAAALTAPIAVALTGSRLSAWPTATTTIFAQLVFHALYSLPYTGVSDFPDGHQHHGQLTPAPGASAANVHAAATAVAADAAMITAHLIAAALTVVVITHGERSLITLAQWLTLMPVRVVLAVRPLSVAYLTALPSVARVWIPHPMNVAKTRSTRGPPVLA